jgi:hypothetical protein
MVLDSLAQPIEKVDVACSAGQVEIYQILMMSYDTDADFVVVGGVVEDKVEVYSFLYLLIKTAQL